MDASERRKRASSEAADWFARLQAGEMERAERQQFVEWLRESYVHVTEMLRIAQVHAELKQFEPWARISTGPKTADDKVVQLPTPPDEGSQHSHFHPPRPPPFRLRSRRGHGLRGFAAAAAVVAIVSAAIVTTGVVLPKIRGQVIETERGERREIVLSDGSVVEIDPETRLRVKYADEVRRVFLERGRALFHVAKNANRPFLVAADDTMVRAVGTAFGVEHLAHRVIITVAEGKVAVFPNARAVAPAAVPWPSQASHDDIRVAAARARAPAASTLPKPPDIREHSEVSGQPETQPGEVFLTADQQVTVGSSGSAEPVREVAIREVDSRRALAWAEGRLIFQNDGLGTVIAEFNRYNRVQLSVTDPALAAKPVSGVFNAADPEAFIAFLQSVTAVEIVRDGDRSITIGTARPP